MSSRKLGGTSLSGRTSLRRPTSIRPTLGKHGIGRSGSGAAREVVVAAEGPAAVAAAVAATAPGATLESCAAAGAAAGGALAALAVAAGRSGAPVGGLGRFADAAPAAPAVSTALAMRPMRMSEFCTTYKRKKGSPAMRKSDKIARRPPRAPPPGSKPKQALATASRATVTIVDGQIVIEERAVEVEPPPLPEEEVPLVEVTEDADVGATSASFVARVTTERWGLEETRRFYTALQQFGTDFTLMRSRFPGRTQRQLKNKFKTENRVHYELVSLALTPKISRVIPGGVAAQPLAIAAPPLETDALAIAGAPPDGAADAARIFDPAEDDDDDLVEI